LLQQPKNIGIRKKRVVLNRLKTLQKIAYISGIPEISGIFWGGKQHQETTTE